MSKKRKTEKKLMGFNLPLGTQARVRSAVYHTPGLTSDALAEMALNAFVDALERKRGEKFPDKAVKLNPGRPIRIDLN